MTSQVAQPAPYVPTRVLVVDDHALFRRGLRIALSQELDLEVVAECADTPSAVEHVLRLRPDVALVDVGTPFEGGLAACAAITAADPDVRVLLLASGADAHDHAAAARAGAWGFLVKDASAGEVAAAIRTTADAPDPTPGSMLDAAAAHTTPATTSGTTPNTAPNTLGAAVAHTTPGSTSGITPNTNPATPTDADVQPTPAHG